MNTSLPDIRRRAPCPFLCFAVLLLVSCSGGASQAPFAFTVPGKPSVPVIAKGSPVEDWNAVPFRKAQAGNSWSLPDFELESPVRFTGDGQAFFIEYSFPEALSGCRLVLFTGDGRELPAGKLPVRKDSRLSWAFFPGNGTLVRGFTVRSDGPGTVSLRGAGADFRAPGLRITRDELEATYPVNIPDPARASAGRLSFTLGSLGGTAYEGSGGILFTLKLGTKDGHAGDGGTPGAEVELTEKSVGSVRTYDLALGSEGGRFSFPTGLTGFFPDGVSFGTREPVAELTVTILPEPGTAGAGTGYDEHLAPISADQGTILAYAVSAWRDRTFELFSWSSFPDVLIFDFSDYAIQTRFFGRLGFFTAVTGEAGKIEDEEYYEGRHAYNAHDYRPEDLSAFFELARKSGRKLNEEETFLRKLCIERGILRADGDGVSPGAGAVLSVSRETTPDWLRKRLLTHESAHGLFYAVKAYRDRCFAIWDSLSDDERGFFLAFLGNKGLLDGRAGYDGYDAGNLYLMVNEMQAHIVQLERGQAEGYFRGYAARMGKMLPGSSALLSRVKGDEGMFSRIRTLLEKAMVESTGIRNADFYTIRPRPAR